MHGAPPRAPADCAALDRKALARSACCAARLPRDAPVSDATIASFPVPACKMGAPLLARAARRRRLSHTRGCILRPLCLHTRRTTYVRLRLHRLELLEWPCRCDAAHAVTIIRGTFRPCGAPRARPRLPGCTLSRRAAHKPIPRSTCICAGHRPAAYHRLHCTAVPLQRARALLHGDLAT